MAGLTELEIKHLPLPAKSTFVKDGGRVPGLFLLVQPTGRKSWSLFYRAAGKQKKLTIGPWPDVTPAKARDLASQARASLSSGRDPHLEKVQARRRSEEDGRLKFEIVLETFMKRHVDANALRSAAEIRRMFEREVTPRWKGRMVTEITKRDIIELVDGVADRGAKVQANRVLANVRRFFNWCVERDLLVSPPTFKVKGAVSEKTIARDRALTGLEIRAVWNACGELGYPFASAFRLLLLTGQRREEVLQAKWSEIDLEGALWTLPRSRTKNNKAHSVPLSASAVEIIKALPRFKDRDDKDCDLLFPSTSIKAREAGRAISGVSKAKAAVDAAMAPKIAPWRLHDLRRTVVTELQAMGFSRDVRDAVTNHISGGGVDAIYARHGFTDEKRRALDAWADRLAGLVRGTPTDGNVVLIVARVAA